jgi:PPOX class probable F420-dependent enzyme
MPVALSDTARRLLDGKTYATLATVNPDGTPQSSVVWAKRDGDDVLISTTSTRQKARNLSKDPHASVTFFDPDEPFVYAEIRGEATVSEAGGRELIDELSVKYTGDAYPVEPEGTVRVVIRVTADRVLGR